MLAKVVGWRRERSVLAVLLCLPMITLVAVLVGYPLLRAVYLSFTSWSGIGPMRWVGAVNFKQAMKDQVFRECLRNTFVYSAVTVILVTVMAFTIAQRMFNIRSRRLDSTLRAVYFLPHIIPLAIVGALWRFIYNPSFGLLNQTLSAIGLGKLAHMWLAEQSTALGSVIAVNVWRLFGFYMILYYAGLQDIPAEIYESARLDGASRWHEIKYLSWPILRPVTQLVVVLTTIYSLRGLDLIYLMTQGGPGRATYVIALHVFQTAFLYSEFGYASALAFVLFAIVFVISSLMRRVFRIEE